jgi:prepilin-type N-terminal cleavage/methylation domain-containing protein
MAKKGFTIVEIMIVVVILGLLAAIGIPTILNSFASSQNNARARNIAEVEKAKGVLTLPESSQLPGAMGLTDTTMTLSSGEALTNLMAALRIQSPNELKVGDKDIRIGTLSAKANYND